MKTAGNVLSVVLLLVMTVAVSWSDGEFTPPELVSVDESVDNNETGSVTKDGRYVVFAAGLSTQENLYIRDRLKNITTTLDISKYGHSTFWVRPYISENGRYIFFTTNKFHQINEEFIKTNYLYRYDTKTKKFLEVASEETDSLLFAYHYWYAASGDGNIVATYSSFIDDTTPPDINKPHENSKSQPNGKSAEEKRYWRVVIKNILTGEVTMTNRINYPISAISISRDGSVLSYQRVVKGEEHRMKNYSYLYWEHDIPEETVYYSRLLAMEWVIPGIHSRGAVHLSGDGRFIVFEGFSDSYPQITIEQAYVYDVQNMTTELASVYNQEGQLLGDYGAKRPFLNFFGKSRISDDGRYVVFAGRRNAFYRRDMMQKVTQRIIEFHGPQPAAHYPWAINSDASYLVFNSGTTPHLNGDRIIILDSEFRIHLSMHNLYILRIGSDEFSETEAPEVSSGDSSDMNNRKQGNGSSSGGGFPPAGNNDESSSLRPEVQASLSQTEIWPPNQKEVSLTLSGSVSTAGTCEGIRLSLSVVDEYNAYGFNSGIPIASDCSFSTMVTVEAWRDGQDMDGRKYTFSVTATNSAGKTSMELNAIVPHDQGN